MAKKKRKDESSTLSIVLLWTFVLALTFSAGLITGQRLLRREHLPPLVSLRQAEVENSEVLPLKTEFSFFKKLTKPEKKDLLQKKDAKKKDTKKKLVPSLKDNVLTKPAKDVDNIVKSIAAKTSNLKDVVSQVKEKAKTIIDKEGKLPAKYTLQLSSHPTKVQAEREIMRLKKIGYEPHLVSISIPDRGRVFRVRLGKFHSMDEARKFQGAIKSKRDIASFVTPL